MTNSRDPAATLFFGSVDEQLDNVKLGYQGVPVPSWLDGVLLRNGPAQFHYGNEQLRHFFDGAAMLQSLRFTSTGIYYSNRFLDSEEYRRSTAQGRLVYTSFGTAPQRRWWQKVSATFRPRSQFGGNNSVNITELNNAAAAISDYPYPHTFGVTSAATLEKVQFRDTLKLFLNSPHPLWDAKRGELINIGVRPKLGFGSGKLTLFAHSIFRIHGVADSREEIATTPIQKLPYLHSFALTDRYVVLTEHPDHSTIRKLFSLALAGKALRDAFRYYSTRKTRFIVIERASGKTISVIESEPFFMFHHCNAFEQQGDIVIDLLRYPDNQVVDAFYLENLNNPRPQDVAALRSSRPYRYRLDLGRGVAKGQPLADIPLEMPNINFNASRADYRYLYGASFADEEAMFFNQLVKLNVTDGSVQSWSEDACFVAEPRFVAKPGSNTEDEGVVLAIALDSCAKRTFLLILDAAKFTEIGRAQLPHVVTWGLHGLYTNLS